MTDLDVVRIMRVIPHRYPFLLVDRILEVEDGKRAIGIKCVTVNEPFFSGHFPDFPVMPGVLIAEALAQVGAVAVLGAAEAGDRIPFLAGLDNFRFRKQVVPGDVVRLEVTLDRLRRHAGRGHGVASVDGITAAEGDIMFVLADAASRAE